MDQFDRKEWYTSRGISIREADRVSGQLRGQYLYIGKAMRGEPVPTMLLETELVQLVSDVKRGRFPLSHAAHRKALS
jgi:hypothetical protein